MSKKYQTLPLKVIIREGQILGKVSLLVIAEVYPWNFATFLPRESFSL